MSNIYLTIQNHFPVPFIVRWWVGQIQTEINAKSKHHRNSKCHMEWNSSTRGIDEAKLDWRINYTASFYHFCSQFSFFCKLIGDSMLTVLRLINTMEHKRTTEEYSSLFRSPQKTFQLQITQSWLPFTLSKAHKLKYFTFEAINKWQDMERVMSKAPT